jgi:hypothetical protein
MLSQAAKFDWYQSTVQASDPQQSGLVDHLLAAWDLTDWVPAKNLNGYTHGGAIVRGDRTLAHLCWGGNFGVNVKTTSDESPVLAAALRNYSNVTAIPHLPTRVDSCCDWDEPGLFDSLAKHLIAYAMKNRLAINQQGDWERGQGRTLYIGSKDSPVRLVLYEKGYEQGGGASLDWVRLEARVRPKKAHRYAVASWDAQTVFCAGWIPDALHVLDWEGLQKRAVGTVWRQEDTERSRAALLRQYGRVMSGWAEEVGGWSNLGEALGRELHPAT